MRFIRLFVDLQSGALFRRASARRYTRVRDSLQRAFSARCRRTFALSFTQLVDDPETLCTWSASCHHFHQYQTNIQSP